MRRVRGFDSLRLAAALMVMWGHAWPIHGDGTGYGFGAERVGVAVFFAVSGYLVTQSWQRDPGLFRFLARRALRVLPGLWGVVLFTVFVLGPAVSPPGYWARPETWTYLGWMALVPQLRLPGAFAGNPGAGYVNTSLWTLPLEAVCYAVLTCLGTLGGLGRIAAALALGAALWGCLRLGGPVMPLLACFAGGSLVALLGVRVRLPWGDPPEDVSYGVYLYAFPMQQLATMLLVAVLPGSALACLLAALPPTFVLAWLSWRWIERPALRWKPAAGGMRAASGP